MINREQYSPGPAGGAQIEKDGENWIKGRDRESLHRLEQMGSANPPVAVHLLHYDRRRQFPRYGDRESSRLGSLFATASSFLNVAHGSLSVRVAVCRQMARVPPPLM